MEQKLIFTNHPGEAIEEVVAQIAPASVFVITDGNVSNLVIPVLEHMSPTIAAAQKIVCRPGDEHKNLDSLSDIWRQLNELGATRRSLIINIGGGVVSDMGGFAAATFKRGVTFVNVPTTLLAAVDASVGGKTGVNFNECKNEVGCFAEPSAVVISTTFFNTLPERELISGYAEMLKHGLLESKEIFAKLLNYDIAHTEFDPDTLLDMLKTSVDVKRRVVEVDMHETGLRKALNLGHTAGHAFESLAMRRQSPVPHGYAVAWGLVVELVLSNLICHFPSDVLHTYASYVKNNYGSFAISCRDYPELLELMTHDKKNPSAAAVNFTLLKDVGDVTLDNIVDADQIKNALDIYCDLMGL